ncbi:MAG: phosphatidate cytidylyltransferase [Bacteroidales bacterium]|nr:phosphatidate cytidylyltransferase [Bacteroidales bacterium]
MKLKDIGTRAVAGTLYILFILLGVLGGRFSFVIIFGSILGLSLFEFYRMMEKDTSHAISKIFNIVMGVVIFFSVFLYLEEISLIALPISVLLYLLILISSAIFIKREDILHGIIYSGFGQMYVTMPMSLLLFMSYFFPGEMGGVGYHYAPVLAIFVFIWVNDTAAYFFGSLLGKRKLMEHISPKKTVEGFVAGILFTVIASIIFARIYQDYSVVFWIGSGVVVAIFGTMGDLFESLIKRTSDVKDSGNLIPGHGGILDRIDSLLIAIPAIYLYFTIYSYF